MPLAAPAVVTDALDPAAPGNVFRREGDTWCVAFGGRTVRLRDLKGLHYLARVLAKPGRRFHVLELVALESGVPVGSNDTGDAGTHLDERAKQAPRRRLSEIAEDVEQATARNDQGRVAQAEAERGFLLRELSRAVGLGGRDRLVSSSAERARASVTRAVRQAIDRIREHHPAFADHLHRAVRTGVHCSYVSDPKAAISWTC